MAPDGGMRWIRLIHLIRRLRLVAQMRLMGRLRLIGRLRLMGRIFIRPYPFLAILRYLMRLGSTSPRRLRLFSS